MNRSDVQVARAEALRFVGLCDELLAVKSRRWSRSCGGYVEDEWDETCWIAGALTGSHRRSSLDLTRSLANMRRRR